MNTTKTQTVEEVIADAAADLERQLGRNLTIDELGALRISVERVMMG